MSLPFELAQGERARLLPVLKDSKLEDRATSIFLSMISAVPTFARQVLGGIGVSVGKNSKVDCYTQIVLPKPKGSDLRPDGLISVRSGKKTWLALVESKIGNGKLEKQQLTDYLALAQENGIDAVISISNDFAALPTHHPISFNQSELKKRDLFHWSWMYLSTEALLTQQGEEIEDEDHIFLLEEYLRYFDHPAVGVKGFQQMNAEWKPLISSINSGAALSKKSPEIENSVGAWHQESKDLCLILSKELNTMVKEKLAKKHVNNPANRLQDDAAKLVQDMQLDCVLQIPDAASAINVKADLRARSITCSMELAAPGDKPTNKGRLGWLLRQLKHVKTDGYIVRAWHKNVSQPVDAPLAVLLDDPTDFGIEGKDKALFSRFEVRQVLDLGAQFAGSRTFIERLESMVPSFYKETGEHLRAWVAPPPKIQAHEVEEV